MARLLRDWLSGRQFFRRSVAPLLHGWLLAPLLHARLSVRRQWSGKECDEWLRPEWHRW
ncbi:hypothetical protein [uncultured Veillonella sp.]|uniref:hypothetical protein n=1 Tax=uncultured Veillonella sp. TaxID=159268 RepID=UPI00258700AC|nr:hypothetical protein [uncultured Veillonella sp.]